MPARKRSVKRHTAKRKAGHRRTKMSAATRAKISRGVKRAWARRKRR